MNRFTYQTGPDGKKYFSTNNQIYTILGIVHTHPPDDVYKVVDGFSPDDLNVSAQFNAPIFAITDEGVWKGTKSGGTSSSRIIIQNTPDLFNCSLGTSDLFQGL